MGKELLIHCSYHKCLTVYFSKVFGILYNKLHPLRPGYKHFNSLLEEFYNNLGELKVLSVNNHKLDFKKLGEDFKITRFIRDPRDLVVSGYFYHRRGAEKWCNIEDPSEEDFRVVNGNIPKALPSGYSYSSFLQSISKKEGLLTEIEFRKKHFESMLEWPDQDPRVKLFKYEELLGNERKVFKEIFDFYNLPFIEKWIGILLAEKYSFRKRKGHKHIRNPSVSQWRDHFTSRVNRYFNECYSSLLKKYNYLD